MKIKLDPSDHYSQPSPMLLQSCGFIPYFFEAIKEDIIPHETTAESVMRLLMKTYGFPTDIRMQGTLADNGVYKYEGDPDLYPYVNLNYGGVDCYIYPYGIVAVRTDTDTAIARMD